MSEKGMQVLHSRNLLPGMKHVDLKFVRNMFMENRIESDSLELGKKRRVKN